MIRLKDLGSQEECKFFKFIEEDKWRFVAWTYLQNSKAYKAIDRTRYDLTASDIDGLHLRKDPSYVTRELLQREPIVLFQDALYPDLYSLFDGTHRLIGAALLELTSIPCIRVPKQVWIDYVTETLYDDLGASKTPRTRTKAETWIYVASHIDLGFLQYIQKLEARVVERDKKRIGSNCRQSFHDMY